MHKLLGTLVAIILLVVGGYIVFHNSNSQSASVPPSTVSPTDKAATDRKENKMATYSSKQYGFSFDYPSDYTFKESSPDYLLIEKAGGEQYDWTYKVDVYVDVYKDILQEGEKTTDQSFKEFITERVMIGCAVDGQGASIRCDKVTTIEPVGLDSGIKGFKFSLNQVNSYPKDGKQVKENKEIGPFYAFDVAIQTSGQARAVLFSIADFDTVDDSDLTTLSSIASSLKIK